MGLDPTGSLSDGWRGCYMSVCRGKGFRMIPTIITTVTTDTYRRYHIVDAINLIKACRITYMVVQTYTLVKPLIKPILKLTVIHCVCSYFRFRL